MHSFETVQKFGSYDELQAKLRRWGTSASGASASFQGRTAIEIPMPLRHRP